ncbi:glycosyltransferase [Acetobacter tropicalis]|nr:glycosyltransferase [Acetobacter tropicalis]
MTNTELILPQFILRALRSVLYHLKIDFPLFRTFSFEDKRDTDAFRSILTYCEYLQRGYPSDGRITMAIGCVRLLLNIPTASEALEFLKNRSNSRICSILLLCVRVQFQNWATAKDELIDYLTHYVRLPHPIFDILAKTITAQNNYDGWVSLSLQGKLTLIDYTSFCTDDLSISIDTNTLPLNSFTFVRKGPQLEIDLPEKWKNACSVIIKHPYRKYISGVFDIENFLKIDGYVEATEEHIKGWACYRSEPERPVKLSVTVAPDRDDHPHSYPTRKHIQIVTRPTKLFDIRTLSGEACLPYFSISLKKISFLGKHFSVKTEMGLPLYGSPLHINILAEQALSYARATREAFPEICRKPSFSTHNTIKRVAIIIPVYNGFDITRLCLQQVIRYKPDNARIIIINDKSPNKELTDYLEDVSKKYRITLLHNKQNKGFPASANRGMRQRNTDEDVILLNSDALVSEKWIFQLQKAVYSEDDIGTATPLSNNATIFSYPNKNGNNPLPTIEECENLNTIMIQTWQGELPEVPTAHGFCMYIKSDCLKSVGLLREDIFAQGYGEENDFSRRAAALGWRHVACLGTYVGHAESQSFSHVKTDLIRRNLSILNDLHKGYDQLIRRWQQRDPLFFYRRRLDLTRYKQDHSLQKSVFLIMHDRAGGILRHVGHRAIHYTTQGYAAFILKPDILENGHTVWRLESILKNEFPNLIIPRSLSSLRYLVQELDCQKIEIHSYIGNGLDNILHITRLGLPYDVYIHDYSWFCPQITLTQKTGLYCGEPGKEGCQACLIENGSKTGESCSITALRKKSATILEQAEQVIAPSHDTAQRLRRYFDIPVNVVPWEIIQNVENISFSLPFSRPKRTIGILGAISVEKGFYQILALARFIAQNTLPIEFVLIGYSCDDNALLETGVVKITGHYKEFEIKAFVTTCTIDWFFLPSIWPETWSYVLTQIWMTDKPAIAYDIGAPAERIRHAGGGINVPLHMPYSRLAQILYDPGKFQTLTSNDNCASAFFPLSQ